MNSELFEPEVKELIELDTDELVRIVLKNVYDSIHQSPHDCNGYDFLKGLLLCLLLERHEKFSKKKHVAKIALLALQNAPESKDRELYKKRLKKMIG